MGSADLLGAVCARALNWETLPVGATLSLTYFGYDSEYGDQMAVLLEVNEDFCKWQLRGFTIECWHDEEPCAHCAVRQEGADDASAEEAAAPAEIRGLAGMKGYTVTFSESGWIPDENGLLAVKANKDGRTFTVTPAGRVSAGTALTFVNGGDTFTLSLAVNDNGTLTLLH